MSQKKSKKQLKKEAKSRSKAKSKSLKIQQTSTTSTWWRNRNVLLLLGGILLLTFISFYPSLNAGFTNWDDHDYVTESPYIVKLNGESIKTMFTEEIASNYHPLTILSLSINYQISKLDAGSYHWTNLILHLLNVVLVFWFVYLFFDRKIAGALLTAFLFAIHPMHVESVAWIAERKDVLYAFFFVAALITYLKYISNEKKSLYIYTLILFVLSCLSKPTAVMLPVILLMIDWYKNRAWTTRVFIEKIPFFALSVLFGIVTIMIQKDTAVIVGESDTHSIFERLIFACYGAFMYIYKLFIPTNLSAFHPYPKALSAIHYLAPVVVLGLGGLMWWSLRKTKVIAFGLLFYGAMIALTLQFVQVGNAIISDRYTYVAYIGLFLIFGWLLDNFLSKKNTSNTTRYGVLGGIGAVGLLLCFLTYQRCQVWQNSGSLWSNVISQYPNSHIAHNQMGNYLVEEKSYDEALGHLTQAVNLKPSYYKARISRGKLYRRMKKYSEALTDYNKAIEIEGNRDEAYNNRGNVFFEMQEYDKALADYEKVATLNPNDPKIYGNTGAIYAQTGRHQKAIEYLSKAIGMDPGYQDAYMNRGTVYARTGNAQQAISDFSQYLQRNNRNPMPYYWRGEELAKMNRHNEAINDYSRAIQLNPQNKNFYAKRAISYQAIGNTQKAQADAAKGR